MSADQRYLFDLQGFIALPKVLSTDEVTACNAAIDANPQDFHERPQNIRNAKQNSFSGPGRGQSGRLECGSHLQWPHRWSNIFRQLLAHPAVSPVINELVGEGYRLDHLPLLLRQRRGVEGFDLHGGNISHSGEWNKELSYNFQYGRMHNNLLAMSVQLTSTTPGEGGFCIIPGSHKANLPCPPSLQSLRQHSHVLHQLDLEAGDVLLFSEATTHGALPWTGPEERRIALYRFSPPTLAYGRGYLGGWPPEMMGELTEGQRAVLQPPYANRLERQVLEGEQVVTRYPRDEDKKQFDHSIFGQAYF